MQILSNTQLDQPQARRVTFSTPEHNIFYMELAMDKTEFIQLPEFERTEQENPDDILANAQQYRQENTVDVEPAVDDDFLKNLGF